MASAILVDLYVKITSPVLGLYYGGYKRSG